MVSRSSYEYLSSRSLASSFSETAARLSAELLTLRGDALSGEELALEHVEVAALAHAVVALPLDLVQVDVRRLV